MRANAVILIVIGLLLLVGTVGAVIPDAVTITSNKNWIIANNVDQSTITVLVTNNSIGVPNANVAFSLNNTLGTLSSIGGVTGPAGTASTTFKANTKSGATQITATITYSDAEGSYTNTVILTQNIDHDSPFYDFTISPPIFTNPAQGTVATQVPLKVAILDKWGNPIDNRNPAYTHNVGLHASSALSPTEPYFVGYGQDLFQPLDANGTLSVNVRLTTKTGSNKILMDSFEGKISSQIVWINAVAGATPYSMTGTITPASPIPANNIAYYTLDYHIYDIYGNPQAGKSIWISTNLSGETTPNLYAADANGLIRFIYGPKISLLTANITAIAQDNASVSSSIIAQFVNASPTNMVLAVTPQTMASLDIVPSQQAFVRATVIDNFGNPVQDETVTFSLGSSTGTLTTQPYLDSTSAITDKDGNAIVIFHPGSFPAWGQPGYNSSATGSVPVIATWKGTSQDVTAFWKNYPYLSIETSANPQSLKVNETIDVTIDVIGNGYLMQGGQVTAVLDMDFSSNMFSNKDPPYSSRAESSKAAAYGFVDDMLGAGQSNYIGLNSFGGEVNDPFHLPPQTNKTLLDLKISQLKKGNSAKDFGPSITESMLNITSTASSRGPDKIRAVIVLNDGGSNINNQGEMDAIIAYANSQNPPILIFTVLYYDGNSQTTNAYDTLNELADRSGGQFFHSKNPAELAQAFHDIATILKTAAGVDATMMLNFQQVAVNGTLQNGGDVFSYVPVPDPAIPGTGFANLVSTPTPRDSILGRTRIMWTNSSFSVINQSVEWTTGVPQSGPSHAPYQLYFNVGTINITEQWNTTYRLRVNQTGLINLFNCTTATSSITFNNGSENMCLPNLFITVNPNTTPFGLQNGSLSVTNLVPQSGAYNVSVPMQWNLKYTGVSTGIETYYYCFITPSTPCCDDPICDLQFMQFDQGPPFSDTIGGEIPRNTKLDVKNFPAGEYRIKVIASVPGIPSAWDKGGFTKSIDNSTVNILLQ